MWYPETNEKLYVIYLSFKNLYFKVSVFYRLRSVVFKVKTNH